MKIGSLELKGQVFAAPMAGVSDSVFRRLCMENGAALCYTEMVSAKALSYDNPHTEELLYYTAEETPIFVQLFGSEPEILAEQAAALCGRFAGIDLNMGCPAPKIFNNHEGSALLRKPELVGDIVSAVVKAADGALPVTVKIRKGIRPGEELAPEIAKICESAGATALCVHGRTTAQGYSGVADWETIRRVKESVRIPVIGNGDVTDGPSAKRMLEETGCDAVMVARATRGNPWLFDEINTYLATGEEKTPQTAKIKLKTALWHAAEECKLMGEENAMRQMRSILPFYVHGLRGATALKRAAVRIGTLAELENLIQEYIQSIEI